MKARVLLMAMVVAVPLSIIVPAQAATLEERGYLTVRDGTRLRYHVMYPAEPAGARFPVLVNHDGYQAGSNVATNGVEVYAEEILRRGYALLGVSVRGTGCSEGAFDPFETRIARDAHDAIEWAATQPWSDGRVGMIGVSMGGIMQLLAGGERPPHLRAIAPSSALADMYRDVVFPGGIFNEGLPFVWTPIQKSVAAVGVSAYAIPDGDADCPINYTDHEIANAGHHVAAMMLRAPFADDPQPNGESFYERSPLHGLPRIDVPTLMLGTWQDEQLPARWFEYLAAFRNQDRLWVNTTNGYHGRDFDDLDARATLLDFLDRFVREIDNDFEERVPRLRVGMETFSPRLELPYPPLQASWTIDLPIDFQPTPRALYLGAGGRLSDEVTTGPSTSDRYRYPMPSADVTEIGVPAPFVQSGRSTWKTPVPPGGALAYTTEPLEDDLVALGPASLDVWVSSSAPDTDLQVTVTEVRPDGMETYVQRGWLRASHRTLDPERSTALRPYHTHARADAAPLTPGEPTLMRVEVFPFAHAFRAGSRLRVWIDGPTGRTGLWSFAHEPTPAVNTIHFGPQHPAKLMVGVIPGEVARAPLPSCDTLINQPCRVDPLLSVKPRVCVPYPPTYRLICVP